MPLNIRITATQEPEPSICLGVAAFIRCLEIAREEIKDDTALHEFVEALQSAAGDQPLDTEAVAQAEESCGLTDPEDDQS